MKALKMLALILVIVGGLNWGLVALLQFNLVAFIFTEGSLLANVVYTLVGISAVYTAIAILPEIKD